MNHDAGISPARTKTGARGLRDPQATPPEPPGLEAAKGPAATIDTAFQAAIDRWLAAPAAADRTAPACHAAPAASCRKQIAAIAVGSAGLALLILLAGSFYSRELDQDPAAVNPAEASASRETSSRPGAAADWDAAATGERRAEPGDQGTSQVANRQSSVSPSGVADTAAELTTDGARLEARVRRVRTAPMDLIVTPFASYDAALVTRVREHWLRLLDLTPTAPRAGKVVLGFHLSADGHITGLTIKQNEAGGVPGLLSQRAVRDPSPYPQWPNDMRRAIAKGFREVTFTFDYHAPSL